MNTRQELVLLGAVPDLALEALRWTEAACARAGLDLRSTGQLAGADLHDDVELAGRVEVGDRCVIDEAAQLIDAVVLPGTYVGRGVRLQNAIAHGPCLYRADLGTCQCVEDPLLLAGPASASPMILPHQSHPNC